MAKDIFDSSTFFIYQYGEHLSPGIDCSVEPSVTKQSFKDDCDINLLMARYEKSGVIPEEFSAVAARYGDATEYPGDYQDAMFLVANANSMFELLPAQLRFEFDNDPGRLLQFLDDPRNDARAIELGLKVARAVDASTPSDSSIVEPLKASPASS